MSYTDSPVFKMIPTHCSVCNRPLVDATSTEFGIGPICRKKYHYEDAYPISDKAAPRINTILSELKDTGVADAARTAVLADDSRKAVNVLNRAVAIWSRENPESEEVGIALNAMKAMGYTTLADKIGSRLSAVEITVENGFLLLDTPFDPHFVVAIKSVRGRRWDRERKLWKVPVSKKADAWKALQSAYEGLMGHGPKGMFRI